MGPGTFQHLGGVYALGADGASQSVIVSNCTFLDVSGGGVKLGKSGERIVFVENAETGVMEAKSAGYVAVGTPLDEDDGDDDSHLFGVLDGSFPGEEAPLYGWGTSTGPRDNPAGMCLGIAGG